MSISTIIAKALGIILLLLWLVFIPAGRHWFRQMRGLREQVDNFRRIIMSTTIFQWHILPFIVGVGLILSGSLWVILVLPAAWIVSLLPFPKSFISIFPLISGWVYGGLAYSRFGSGSRLCYYVSSGVGVLCMFLFHIVIIAIVTMPRRGD